MIRIQKTIYDPPEPSDGRRVLVMTLWPRGVSKAKVDVWFKELGAPMDLVHAWKAGRVAWRDFARAYNANLGGKEGLLRELAAESRDGDVTLLCTDKDPMRCHRSLLKEAIERQASKEGPRLGASKHKRSSKGGPRQGPVV